MILLIIIALLGLAAVVAGACFLVGGASSVARRVHMSEFVIGMVIVGVGTSLPELLVSFFGAVQGNGDVAIGNIVGSNIFNVLLIFGVTIIIKPVKLSKPGLIVDVLICLAASLVLYVMSFGFSLERGGELSRFDGMMMLAMFAVFIWYSFKSGRKDVSAHEEVVELQPISKSLLAIGFGLALLVFGAKIFVDKSVDIAHLLNISDSFIAITLLAGGTSLPELAVSVTAAFKGHNEIALGNIVGSNIFNILLILGLCSTITPLQAQGVGPFDMAVMIYAVLLLVVLVAAYRNKRVPRWQSLVLLFSYAVYIYAIA